MNLISAWIRAQLDKGLSPAQRVRATFGADAPEAFAKPRFRHATPQRIAKGRNGTKRAGAYARGLRNWIARTQAAQQAQRLAKKMAAVQ